MDNCDKEKEKEYKFWREYFSQREEDKAYYKKRAAERLAEVKRTIKHPVENAAKAVGCRVTMARDWDVNYSGGRYDLWRVRLYGDWVNAFLERRDVDYCRLVTHRDLNYTKRNIGEATEEDRADFKRCEGIIAVLEKLGSEWQLEFRYKHKRKGKENECANKEKLL